MTRRVFLGLTISTSAILLSGSFQFFNTKKRFHIFIKSLWPWLEISPGAIDQFIDDYYKYKINTLSKQIKLSLLMILESTPIFNKIRQNTRNIYREKITHQFLLSTDFFQKGMDESRTIKYVLYYDPYINPCYTPRP